MTLLVRSLTILFRQEQGRSILLHRGAESDSYPIKQGITEMFHVYLSRRYSLPSLCELKEDRKYDYISCSTFRSTVRSTNNIKRQTTNPLPSHVNLYEARPTTPSPSSILPLHIRHSRGAIHKNDGLGERRAVCDVHEQLVFVLHVLCEGRDQEFV